MKNVNIFHKKCNSFLRAQIKDPKVITLLIEIAYMRLKVWWVSSISERLSESVIAVEWGYSNFSRVN